MFTTECEPNEYHDYPSATRHFYPTDTRHSDAPSVLRTYIERIKARHGVSQRDQADALGVSWTTMRNWLNGTASWPKTAQMALKAWAYAPLAADRDGIAQGYTGRLDPDDERGLIAAWQLLRGEVKYDDEDDEEGLLWPSTVKDWPARDLAGFTCSRPGGYIDEAFKQRVREQLQALGGVMPARGEAALYRMALEWFTPAVLAHLGRLAGVIEVDDE